uniref:Cystatin domain-containing protein n=1 Tax=Fagus sylvatica TaxID=28930 RepID=A0A2N9FLC9_FAGSY
MTMNDEDDELPDMTMNDEDDELKKWLCMGDRLKRAGIEPISEPWSDSRKKRFGDYSKEAIEKYNTEQKKNFKFKEVVKANAKVVQGVDYYITFKAEDASTGVIQTFQTLVYDGIKEREITLIRIKPISKQGNEDPTI